jgi:hypothetical protein
MILAFDNASAAVFVIRCSRGRVVLERYSQHGVEWEPETFRDNVAAIEHANESAGRLLFFWEDVEPAAPAWPSLAHLLK